MLCLAVLDRSCEKNLDSQQGKEADVDVDGHWGQGRERTARHPSGRHVCGLGAPIYGQLDVKLCLVRSASALSYSYRNPGDVEAIEAGVSLLASFFHSRLSGVWVFS